MMLAIALGLYVVFVLGLVRFMAVATGDGGHLSPAEIEALAALQMRDRAP